MFEQFAVFCVVVLVVMLVVLSIVFRALGIKKFAWSFATAYFIFSTVFHILNSDGYNDSSGEIFYIPVLLAFPSAILAVAIAIFYQDVIIPVLIVSVILGTGQYFLIGMIVDIIIKKRKEYRIKKRSSVKVHWSRSARLSLWSFLLTIVFIVIGSMAFARGMRNYDFWGGSGLGNEPSIAIAIICVIIVLVSNLISIVSGFIAVKRCRVVLWWLIPTVLVTGVLLFVTLIAK